MIMNTIIAPAILERSSVRLLWIIPICPRCAQRHIHGGGTLDGNPRALLGHRVAHCLDSDGISYELVEVGGRNADRLRVAADERLPFQVIGRYGDVLSRHRSASAAHTALVRARRYDPWATAVDARLMALADVLEEIGVAAHA